MSLRLKKQLWRKSIEKNWVPGPGHYKIHDEKDIGNEKRNFQTWKTPLRETKWHQNNTDGADMMFGLQDYKGLARTMEKGEMRLKTTMSSPTTRSNVMADSRRPREKINIKTFETAAPSSTTDELGPGTYRVESRQDIGKSASRFQKWADAPNPSKLRPWWLNRTDAPADLFQSDLSELPSRVRVGGSHSYAWPLQEDDDGNIVFPGPKSLLGSRSARRLAMQGIRARTA